MSNYTYATLAFTPTVYDICGWMNFIFSRDTNGILEATVIDAEHDEFSITVKDPLKYPRLAHEVDGFDSIFYMDDRKWVSSNRARLPLSSWLNHWIHSSFAQALGVTRYYDEGVGAMSPKINSGTRVYNAYTSMEDMFGGPSILSKLLKTLNPMYKELNGTWMMDKKAAPREHCGDSFYEWLTFYPDKHLMTPLAIVYMGGTDSKAVSSEVDFYWNEAKPTKSQQRTLLVHAIRHQNEALLFQVQRHGVVYDAVGMASRLERCPEIACCEIQTDNGWRRINAEEKQAMVDTALNWYELQTKSTLTNSKGMF